MWAVTSRAPAKKFRAVVPEGLNFLKAVELAVNGGKDLLTGDSYAADTPDCNAITSFDELMDIVRMQLHSFAEGCIESAKEREKVQFTCTRRRFFRQLTEPRFTAERTFTRTTEQNTTTHPSAEWGLLLPWTVYML